MYKLKATKKVTLYFVCAFLVVVIIVAGFYVYHMAIIPWH